MSDNQFNVGPVIRMDTIVSDGYRCDRSNALVNCDGHARWYEQTSRGIVFCAATTPGGITMPSGVEAPPGAASKTLLSILNPIGSGVNIEVIQGWVFVESGTPTAGVWAWCSAIAGVSITAGTSVTPQPMWVNESISKVKAWSNTALTGGPAHVNTRVFPASNVAAAIDGNTNEVFIDMVCGALVVLPGGLLTIAPPGIGAADVKGAAGILYAEVPRLLREFP